MNLYNTLDVHPNASKSEIKKAYRKLSKKYHPERNPGDEEANDKYVKITRAYEVLTDEEKRHVYDHGGEDDLERYEQGQYR